MACVIGEVMSFISSDSKNEELIVDGKFVLE